MSTIDFGYDNGDYVLMAHGQKVYACGVGPQSTSDYSFNVRNAEYLAANMAEFIVNPSSVDYAACENVCAECEDGIKDPVTSDAVTKDNYVYVCLINGQKLYFASHDSRKEYLGRHQQHAAIFGRRRHLLENDLPRRYKNHDAQLRCSQFVSGYSASNGGNISTGLAGTVSTRSEFCTGQGSVMFNGFQTSINGSCVMLFFQPWVLNSAIKYAFGFIGSFLIAVLNESLVKAREVARQKLLKARKLRLKDKLHKMQCKLMLSLLYMVQMTVAYFAMLVVMTYESGLFVALIAGFGAGFMLFKTVDLNIAEERRFTDASTVRIEVGGMSCKMNCGAAVETALKNTPGVTNAVVEFGEKAVYVSGSAVVSDLITAIEAAGYTATLSR